MKMRKGKRSCEEFAEKLVLFFKIYVVTKIKSFRNIRVFIFRVFSDTEVEQEVEEEDEGIKHRIRKLTTRSYPQPTLDSIFERDDN